jgi:hypothetical protein
MGKTGDRPLQELALAQHFLELCNDKLLGLVFTRKGWLSGHGNAIQVTRARKGSAQEHNSEAQTEH